MATTDDTTYTPIAFITKASGALYFGKKSEIYSSAKVTYQPKYEFDTTKFTLKVDIANNDGKGKLDTTGS